MSKLNEEYFKLMANKIYIEPNDEVIFMLKNEYENINRKLEELKKIDITNIEPLTRISQPIKFLREDIEDKEIKLDKKLVLDNASQKNSDFIIIKRIIK
ncbi:MAG: hypothetical protein HDR43_01465 [Mycoplasma sp.]|nr:hypothetical protein [Mycoplasma sp.]